MTGPAAIDAVMRTKEQIISSLRDPGEAAASGAGQIEALYAMIEVLVDIRDALREEVIQAVPQ